MFKITIKENVEALLRDDERCRNDDLYLILKYWTVYDGVQVDLNMVGDLTHTESIRRDRQKIQNEDKKYPPTDPEVREKRTREKSIS